MFLRQQQSVLVHFNIITYLHTVIVHKELRLTNVPVYCLWENILLTHLKEIYCQE